MNKTNRRSLMEAVVAKFARSCGVEIVIVPNGKRSIVKREPDTYYGYLYKAWATCLSDEDVRRVIGKVMDLGVGSESCDVILARLARIAGGDRDSRGRAR
jgi:hypothetical protein